MAAISIGAYPDSDADKNRKAEMRPHADDPKSTEPLMGSRWRRQPVG
jgi:hypothetical protein